MNELFSLKARLVLPVDRPPIDGGVVTILGERIVAVGQTTDAADVTDLGDVAFLPGLVNAHTHLEFSGLDTPLGAPNMPLPDWIRHVLQHRGRGDADNSADIKQGIAESLACGVTTLADIATAAPSEYPNECDLDLTLFGEVIGFSEPRSRSAFDGLTQWLDSNPSASPHRLGLSPHAPYTAHPDLVERVVQLSAQRRLPVATHLAESCEELQLLDRGDGPFRELLEERDMWRDRVIPRGARPLDYLQQLGRAHRALVIHGNYLDEEELDLLAAQADRMSLVYCPRTHAYFGHDPYPLAAALRRGVRVALGTDSRASNPDLDLLAEIRALLAAHPDVPPAEALRLGTLSGAEALGLADQTGTLAPGQFADLAVARLPATFPSNANPHDWIEDHDARAIATWRRGRRVWPAD